MTPISSDKLRQGRDYGVSTQMQGQMYATVVAEVGTNVGEGALRWDCECAQMGMMVCCGGGVGLVKCERGGTVVGAWDGRGRAVCT